MAEFRPTFDRSKDSLLRYKYRRDSGEFLVYRKHLAQSLLDLCQRLQPEQQLHPKKTTLMHFEAGAPVSHPHLKLAQEPRRSESMSNIIASTIQDIRLEELHRMEEDNLRSQASRPLIEPEARADSVRLKPDGRIQDSRLPSLKQAEHRFN